MPDSWFSRLTNRVQIDGCFKLFIICSHFPYDTFMSCFSYYFFNLFIYYGLPIVIVIKNENWHPKYQSKPTLSLILRAKRCQFWLFNNEMMKTDTSKTVFTPLLATAMYFEAQKYSLTPFNSLRDDYSFV